MPIGDPLRKLARLRGVYFDWDNEHGSHHDVGMIAEEVGMVLPEIVNYEENGVNAIGMDYSKMTPLLVEAVNALRAEKDAEIATLNERLSTLERLLSNRRIEVEQIKAEHERGYFLHPKAFGQPDSRSMLAPNKRRASDVEESIQEPGLPSAKPHRIEKRMENDTQIRSKDGTMNRK